MAGLLARKSPRSPAAAARSPATLVRPPGRLLAGRGAAIDPFAASHAFLPRYAACSADERAGLGVAGTARVARAAAGLGTAAWLASPGGLAAAPGRLGVLGTRRRAGASSPGPGTPAAAADRIADAAIPGAAAATSPAAAAAAAPAAAAPAGAATTPAANRRAVQARHSARDLFRPDSVPRAGRPVRRRPARRALRRSSRGQPVLQHHFRQPTAERLLRAS